MVLWVACALADVVGGMHIGGIRIAVQLPRARCFAAAASDAGEVAVAIGKSITLIWLRVQAVIVVRVHLLLL